MPILQSVSIRGVAGKFRMARFTQQSGTWRDSWLSRWEENAKVLKKKTLEDNFERVGSAYSDFSYGYGIGFQVRRRGNLIFIGHDGVVAGYQSSAIFDPKTRLGVIVLCTRKENLAFHALEILANVNRTPDKR